MALRQLTAPATEPVTRDEAKAFLRLEHDAEDAFINSLIKTSRLHIEAALGLALIMQTWRVTSRAGSLIPIALPLFPLGEVLSVATIDNNDMLTEIPEACWRADTDGRPVTIAVDAEFGARVAVDFSAGFGVSPEDVPEPIKQALLLLIAHWYEHRDPVTIGTSSAKVPMTVSALLEPYRQARL